MLWAGLSRKEKGSEGGGAVEYAVTWGGSDQLKRGVLIDIAEGQKCDKFH